jgi:hypothetical protein
MGRPSSFTMEIADQICALLAEGVSLRSVCLRDEMPGMTTVFTWLRANEAFREQYARAKDESADALVEEMLDIADNGENDWMKRTGRDGSEAWVENGEAVGRSKLRLDARKWIASKLKPKKYGDKLGIGQADGMGPVTLALNGSDVDG